MGYGLEKLYYIKNKSRSRFVVEVDLTDPSFPHKEINFELGEIRQFLVGRETIYTVNCDGLLQVYCLKTEQFKEASISQLDTLLIDNFSISPDEKFITVSGCESRMSHKPRQVIVVLEMNSLKKHSMAVLKDTSEVSPIGTVKKTVMVEVKGKLLLLAITDGNCGMYVFDVKPKEMTLICSQPYLHESSPRFT